MTGGRAAVSLFGDRMACFIRSLRGKEAGPVRGPGHRRVSQCGRPLVAGVRSGGRCLGLAYGAELLRQSQPA
jgi:hypothetical protein